MVNDTIAAVATGMSNSGIGIIRISGDEAIDIVDCIYRDRNHKRSLKSFKGNTIHYGFIYDGDEILDEVLISVFKKPASFTAEDTVEINCHGGSLVIDRILRVVVSQGVRLAEPGEFTKRAFLNGRIDLSKAEAVMDIISSKNEMSLKNSVRQLTGSVYNKIIDFRESIINEIAFIESALDDPEHISLDGYGKQLESKISHLLKEMEKLISTFENGKILTEGICTVITGKPNAGKSSLLNLLAGQERAIVTEVPGTTRDILEENINLGGINLRVVDTAGIHSTDDIVEKIGVAKAKKYIEEADLIVYVVDSSVPLDENDFEIMDMIQKHKCVVLFNKSDLNSQITFEDLKNNLENRAVDAVIIKTSTRDNSGMENFEDTVKSLFFEGDIYENSDILITNLRHKEALSEAFESILQVQKSLYNNMPEDFYSIDLMSAYNSLGKIIGEDIGEDIINEIFSRFCLGK